MRYARVIALGLAAVVARPPVVAAWQNTAMPAAEHHLHLRTATAATLLTELGSDEARWASTAADALAALDAASIPRALVLSVAYMFGSPDLDVDDEYVKVRAENDHVRAQVATAPDRLVGACAVNPLADYAFDEIERCAELGIRALKLHFTNSDVDLRNPAHVTRLQHVFQKLGRLEMPAVVHMRTRHDEYGYEDARIFIRDVLGHAPRLPVLIAHMAGWGGYDDATDDALRAFADAMRDGSLDGDRITFDLAAVVFLPEAAGADTATANRVREANRRLAERIRSLGVERVVYGTDWPSWPPVPDVGTRIERNVRLIERALPLTKEELAAVFGNVSEVLGPRR